jgi:hypothetical protein
VLRSRGVLPGKPEPVEPVRALSRFEWGFAEQSECWYPSVALGDTVEEGQRVGRAREYFGETLKEYVAPASGIILFLVTSLAMNEGDPLLAVVAP